MIDPVEVLEEKGGSSICPIRWQDATLRLLDQRLLPHEEEWVEIRSWKGAQGAISDMVVRGAPAIGITAAFGMVLGLKEILRKEGGGILGEVTLKGYVEIGHGLKAARPTAVNLAWAVERMIGVARRLIQRGIDPKALLDGMESEANAIWLEDIEANIAMGDYGADLIQEGATILTHCNAGALATGGYGTALGVIRSAHRQKKGIRVLCDETRPWLQGMRLTAWELMKDGIECALICEGAAGFFMKRGLVDCVVVGADRIAANGDVANKIGTYMLAELAKANSVPFYVAAPYSTIDVETPTGEEIPIEERPSDEVLTLNGMELGPKGLMAENPVFDITPNGLITAIITERGVLRPPYEHAIRERLS